MTKSILSEGDVLALDFDGVIADSLKECLVMGFNAFSKYKQQDRKIHHLNELDLQMMEESKRIRKYIRTGEDYVFIFLALDENVVINDQREFDTFKEKNRTLQPVFHDLFYQQREWFSRVWPHQWIELNPLYPNMTNYLQTFKNLHRLFIITTKEIEYVHLILKAHGIVLKEDNCNHAHADWSKKDIIHKIIKQLNISAAQFHFIDDQADTLLKVQPLGIHCYLAAWGYNDAEQAGLAARNHIDALQLDDFLSSFKSYFKSIKSGPQSLRLGIHSRRLQPSISVKPKIMHSQPKAGNESGHQDGNERRGEDHSHP